MSGKHSSPNVLAGDLRVSDGDIIVNTNDRGFKCTNLGGVNKFIAKITTANVMNLGTSGFNALIRSNVSFLTEQGFDVKQTGRKIEDGAQVAQNFIKINSSLGAGSADLESYGVNSLTDNGAGDWTLNFNAKTDAQYIAVPGGITIANAPVMFGGGRTQTTTSYRIEIYDSAGAAIDAAIINLVIFDAN